MSKVGVIGAGAWGTALAITATRAENDVRIWAREENIVTQINTEHHNDFLPDILLPDTIKATADLKELIDWAEVILLVSPAQFTRPMMDQIVPLWRPELPLVICAKGIENGTGCLLSEIIKEKIPDIRLAVLSGPGFAAEVARQKPTAVTIAAEEEPLATQLVQIMGSHYFRPYSSTDIITPQICGALKNVMAIASGIVEGKNLGDNARAALISRGLIEISRFAKGLGGHMHTVLGLCGIGDLVLTACSAQSRNYSLGMAIGREGKAHDVLAASTKTVEGVLTTKAVLERAQKLHLEMPICETLARVLFEDVCLDDAMNELLLRPFRSESI